MSDEKRPPLPVTPPDYEPPRMRREERTMPDGRRQYLYHFDRTAPTPAAQQKEPAND